MSMTSVNGEHFAPKREERGKHRPPHKPQKPRTSRGTIVFRAVYISLTALAVAAVVVGLFVLWDFLAEYENYLPEKTVENILAEGPEQGDTSPVYESADFTPNKYEDDSAAREYVAGLFKGELTYTKDVKLSTEDTPVYAVKCDGKRVCSLTLTKTGEQSGWGFPLYRGVGYSGVEIPTSDITIIAPDNAEIRINGIPMRELPVKSETVAECEHFYGYIDSIPGMAGYTVSGFTQPPEVTAFRADGSELRQELNGTEYRFTLDGGEPPQELSELAVTVSETYSKFISADASFDAVAKYVPEDVPLYENIRTYESKFYTPHTDYDFLDVKVSDYRRYAEDCVSLRVTYTQRIYSGWYGDFDFATDNTIYLAKSGEGWLATDIVMN